MSDEHEIIKVVIVDDLAEMRRLLRLILREKPYVVVVGEAGDGREAIQIVGALRPDVVVMDVEMPRLDGIEATRKITELWPEVRIVGCTSLEDPRVQQAMYDAGAAGYMDKAQAFTLLAPMVEAAARSESLPVVILDPEPDRSNVDRPS